MTTAPEADGRTARSAKTRDAIADALLDLLVEGNVRPRAREIAQRAGVSLRSVYVHFDDLEDLFCVAARRHYARVVPMLAPVDPSGSLEARARAIVAERARVYARTGAVARATALQAPSSPTLARVVREAYARSRAEIASVFAPELDAMSSGRRDATLAIVDALLGPATWEMLREHHELTDDAAAAIVVDTVVRRFEAVS